MGDSQKSAHDLTSALGSVLTIMLGERFDLINHTLKNMETNFKKEIESIKQETSSRFQTFEKSMGTQFDSISKSLETLNKIQNDERTNLFK